MVVLYGAVELLGWQLCLRGVDSKGGSVKECDHSGEKAVSQSDCASIQDSISLFKELKNKHALASVAWASRNVEAGSAAKIDVMLEVPVI